MADGALTRVSKLDYLALMAKRHEGEMTQSEYRRRLEAQFTTRKPDPDLPSAMPPSFDAALVDPEGWPCECDPPHGYRLAKEKLFVVQHHHPDEGPLICMSPINVPGARQ